MTEKKQSRKFDWGDQVLISSEAPEKFRIGTLGVICSIGRVENERHSREFGVPVGEFVYLVEVDNDSRIEIPECYLGAYMEA